MQTDARDQYLTAKIMTATPQKLHLMLIEGAIRHLLQAKACWGDDRKGDERTEALGRCIDITGEMLASVRQSTQPIAKQLAAVYAFIFRTITEAQVQGDLHKLQDALRLLAIERETWQQVCQKYGAETDASPQQRGATETSRHESPQEPTANAKRSGRVPNPIGSIPPLPSLGDGLSLEA